MSGPLHGVQVVDFSRRLPGPFCTWLLAELGARVIRVEAPDGDPLRAAPPLNEAAGVGVTYEVVNRGKETVVLDLKRPEGREEAYRLVAASDVLVESFRPGLAGRFGLDEASAAKLRPGIVYVSLPGYARGTADADRAAHDLNLLARSGFLGLEAGRDGDLRLPLRPWADLWSGAIAALRTAAALAERGRSGGPAADAGAPTESSGAAGTGGGTERSGRPAVGAFIEVPLAEGILPALAGYLRQAHLTGRARAEEGFRTTSGLPCYNLYRCRDGRLIALAAMEEPVWNRFCERMGRPDWLGRGREGDGRGRLAAEVAAVFATRSSGEWLALLGPADVCCDLVRSPEEVVQDPYYRDRGCIDEEGFVHPAPDPPDAKRRT